MLKEWLHDNRYNGQRLKSAAVPTADARGVLPEWLLAPLLVSMIVVLFGLLFWTLDPRITRENGPIENAQAALIASAAFLHGRKSRRLAGAGARLCHAVLATFCASVVVREIDIHRIGAAPAWATLELIIRGALGVVWLILIGRAFLQIWSLPLRRFAASRVSLLTLAAVVLYFIGWSFERIGGLTPAMAQLWEELFQLCGAVFFFAGSTRALDEAARPAGPSGNEMGSERSLG